MIPADHYTDILKDWMKHPAAPILPKQISGEILFNGMLQMEKFGYSLLLRAAMRLQKADATKAQTYVAKQLQEIMASNSD